MSFLFINKTLRLNNWKTRTVVKMKISVFVICVVAIIYLLLYNLHDCTSNGSFFLGILTSQETILNIYKLGCLIVHVGIEINHPQSNSTFFMYLWFLLWYSMLCHCSSQWTCWRPNIKILSNYYPHVRTEVPRTFSNSHTLSFITIATLCYNILLAR